METLIKEWGKKAAEFEAASKNEMALPFFRLTYEVKAVVYRDCIKELQSAMAKADSTSEKDLPGMQSYNQAFNDGIEAAAENAKLLSHNKSLLHLPYGWEENEHTDLISGTKCTVSKESILKLKKP